MVDHDDYIITTVHPRSRKARVQPVLCVDGRFSVVNGRRAEIDDQIGNGIILVVSNNRGPSLFVKEPHTAICGIFVFVFYGAPLSVWLLPVDKYGCFDEPNDLFC